jgi:hypothetical protein
VQVREQVAIEEEAEHPVRFTQRMISAAHAAEHAHRSAIVADLLLWQNEADGVCLSTAWQFVCDPLSGHLPGRSRQALDPAKVRGTQAWNFKFKHEEPPTN